MSGISRISKTPNPGDKNPESRGYKSWSRDFRNFALGNFSGFFRGFHIWIPIPGISEFSGFFTRGIPKKSHPEANSDLKLQLRLDLGHLKPFLLRMPDMDISCFGLTLCILKI